jgi:hypothetical protein
MTISPDFADELYGSIDLTRASFVACLTLRKRSAQARVSAYGFFIRRTTPDVTAISFPAASFPLNLDSAVCERRSRRRVLAPPAAVGVVE